jgi:tetratricopeptide (TPR) repeat protein
MDYERYVELAGEGAQLVEAGEHEQALTVFRSLLTTDISDLDKASMCYNMAFIYEKMGEEREALASYDRGIGYERKHSRTQVAEHKAAYLARLGRTRESVRLYEEVLRNRSLKEEEKYTLRYNIEVLKQELTTRAGEGAQI